VVCGLRGPLFGVLRVLAEPVGAAEVDQVLTDGLLGAVLVLPQRVLLGARW
jgi:hypothetical protein